MRRIDLKLVLLVIGLILCVVAPTRAEESVPGRIARLAIAVKTISVPIEHFSFKTTRAAWAKVCGQRGSLCGEPEAFAYAPAALIVIAPLVFVADIAVSVVTVPFDLLAGPFRKYKNFKQATWTISGQALDESGKPLGGTPINIGISLLPGGLEAARCGGGHAMSLTKEDGSFSAQISLPVEHCGRMVVSFESKDSDGNSWILAKLNLESMDPTKSWGTP